MFRDFDQIVIPLILMGVVWVICIYQLRKGLRKGEMTFWLQRGNSDGASHSRTCRRRDRPWEFWGLFVFYLLGVFGVPVLVGYALIARSLT